METADAIVVGGGLHGLSAALHLRRRGLDVVLLEKDHAGRHASGVNAGGVRRLGRHLAEVPLSVASMEIWHRIGDLVDDDCGFECRGYVKVAENEKDLAGAETRAATLRAAGFDHEEVVGRDELRRLLPAVSDHCVGGLVSRADGAALPFRAVTAFRRKAEGLGARIVEGARVVDCARVEGRHRVTTADGRVFVAPVLINAAGAWADRIAAAHGETAPVEPIAPMLMITARMPPFVEPVVGALGRPLSFKQFPNGTVLVGGGVRGRALRDENRTDLDFARLDGNARTAIEIFPVMRGATLVRAWAGIEARMPDDIPVIGPSRTTEGLFHAFGFSAHGFQLAPIVGRLLADLVVDGTTDLPIAPFSIGRFAA